MKFLVVEDDYRQAEWITSELTRNFGEVEIQVIATEFEFQQNMVGISSAPPDIIILDAILRWRDPSAGMKAGQKPDGSPSEGGLRCLELLSKNSATASIPVIFYSVRALDLSMREAMPTNAVPLSKDSNSKNLVLLVRSLLQQERPLVEGLGTVFVVHGHDNEAKEMVARLLEKFGFKTVVLHEKPNLGTTIIEKFEKYSDVNYAVVLLTPDDVGAVAGMENQLRPRARQNVVFELGFFFARLGRKRVCALYRGEDIELPSDIQGVLYLLFDDAGAWRTKLTKEMRAAGLSLDMNRIL